MKTRYQSFLALAAALLLSPALFAQPIDFRHDESFYAHEVYLDNNGIGYNKYLKSTTPNENGEYTLRLETFVTGDVKVVSVPTDFVLVLDVSASMLFDYRLGDAGIKYYYTLSEIESPASEYYQDLQLDDQFANLYKYTYFYPVRLVNGQDVAIDGLGRYFVAEKTVNGNGDWTGAEEANHYTSRYIRYVDSGNSTNNGYYQIFRCTVGSKGTNYRTLRIHLKDGSYRYLWNNSILTKNEFDAISATNAQKAALVEGQSTQFTTTIYTGNTYRPKQRRQALLEGVEAFIGEIAAENAADHWATGVTKHQVSMVQFGNNYPSSNPSINVNYASDSNSKVIKAFTEVDASNAGSFIDALNRSTFYGGTNLELGVHLSRMLLEDLQDNNPRMEALNQYGGINRNKVVILFTDGQISAGSGGSPFERIYPALEDGVVIKETGTGKLNAKIYTIDLANSLYAKAMLRHLSSDYPEGRAVKQTGTYSSNPDDDYSGTQVTVDQYYQDASNTHLSDIFTNIAGATTGENTSAQLVAVDKMSESFVLPENISGKVKFYTMQCWGEKEKANGDKYLIFGSPILVPNRASLPHLWVSQNDENSGSAVWNDVGPYDVDGTTDAPKITYEISEDRKTITIKGFDYGSLWCGKDYAHSIAPVSAGGMGSAGNTVHGLSSTNQDVNYSYYQVGYRGFKLIAEFPIVLDESAIGGPDVLTNDESESGLYKADENGNPTGNPIVNYPTPEVAVPVQLTIQKSGLAVGESASFTVERKLAADGATWEPYTTFILTGDSTVPEVKLLNLDPRYDYRVAETGWAWSYTIDSQVYSTEKPSLMNPIIFEDSAKADMPKHGEAKVTNTMKASGSTAVTTP